MVMQVDLSRVIEQVGKDKGIDKKIIIDAIESALLAAAKKRYGIEKEIEAHFNVEMGEIELFEFRTVVDKVQDPNLEVSIKDAHKYDPEAEVGDEIGIKLDSTGFGRIAAQAAKQVIIQKVRDAERDIIYSEFVQRKGEVINGIVRRYERGNLVVDLGRTEAFMPKREQIPTEVYRAGDRVSAFLLDVQQSGRGPLIILSRAHPDFLRKLFEIEVPEVLEGIVTIKAAARDPGFRAKIAVYSTDSDVDPVGACVGMRGSRVQNVVAELRGEKIDIIPWVEEPARFVCNALAPAEVAKVLLDEEHKSMEVIVPDNQLSLAIGKRGQNVRLAAQISGWKIDIVSETKVRERQDIAIKTLTKVPGVTDTMALSLYQHGYSKVSELANTLPEELLKVPGFTSMENVERIIGEANRVALLPPAPPEEIAKVAPTVDEPAVVVTETTEVQESTVPESSPSTAVDAEDITKLDGVGEKTAAKLRDAGFPDIQSIANSSVEELAEKCGLTPKKAEGLINQAKSFETTEKQ
ncbi:MAG: hypothetical protein A3F16_07895 [Deltaproteobacteria bacterium RIFCSPHIGHO2_12_FULL_43_9]|nr:MAG: hypothetical protein A3F16_07895 [Deltaproteobacteria bacterium RIFCSPHIGHO2_12_FULL_43_9]